MSQPPYPPPGGSDPSGQQPGSQGWGQPAQGGQPEEPTQQFGQPPAPPTAQFQPGQYGQPGQPGERDQTAQFGQPEYGQQPQYGQQPPYGQPQYGQPEYGQQYGQPQYGGPGGPGGPVPPGGYGPGGGGPSGGGRGKLIAIIAAVVVVLAGAGVGLFLLLKDDGGDDPAPAAASTSSSSSAPTSETDEPTTSSPSTGSNVDCEDPSGAGSAGVPEPESPCDITEEDPSGDFLPLAIDCAEEDWGACDTLWGATPVDSEWEQYGGTCGGRIEYEGGGTCQTRLGEGGGTTTDAPSGDLPPAAPAPTGAPAEIQPFIDACFNGEMFGCDALRGAEGAAGFEAIYQYGLTCGGRNAPNPDQYCLELYPGN
ncbi:MULTISPECIES: hypothetical protein [unclassified Blastococcus]